MTPEHKALVAAEASFEKIRRILVNCLNEPERSAFWEAVSARDKIRESLSAQCAQPQAGEAVKPGPFNFDRYVNGVLMAEGVTIERQTTLDEAMRAAANIASRGPNDEAPVLVYRPVASPQPANPAHDEAVAIGDAVLAWMVKYDLLDAGNEYYVADVLAVLNDLAPTSHTANPAQVTDAMVEAALNSLHLNPCSWEHPETMRAALTAAIGAGVQALAASGESCR